MKPHRHKFMPHDKVKAPRNMWSPRRTDGSRGHTKHFYRAVKTLRAQHREAVFCSCGTAKVRVVDGPQAALLMEMF